MLVAIESGDLLRTLDNHDKLMGGGRYDMDVSHATLEWQVEEKISEQEGAMGCARVFRLRGFFASRT